MLKNVASYSSLAKIPLGSGRKTLVTQTIWYRTHLPSRRGEYIAGRERGREREREREREMQIVRNAAHFPAACVSQGFVFDIVNWAETTALKSLRGLIKWCRSDSRGRIYFI